MVPDVDKKDTRNLLSTLRETLEATRLEIQAWNLSAEHPTDEGEAQAVRKLAERAAQQARQWTGKMIGELGQPTPYPNSTDSGNAVIDASTVSGNNSYAGMTDTGLVRRIKHARATLRTADQDLEALYKQVILGSRFNAFLLQTQHNILQTGMWLGELLHEFYETQPKQASHSTVTVDNGDGTFTNQYTEPRDALGKLIEVEPHHSPEALADIAAVKAVGTRVVVNNFAEGHALPGLITVAPEPETGYVVVLDAETPMGVKTIALRPTVADAIRDYQIVSEAVAAKNESAPTPVIEPTSTDSGLGAESSPAPSFQEVEGASEALSILTTPNSSANFSNNENELSGSDTPDYPAAEAGVPELTTEDPKG